MKLKVQEHEVIMAGYSRGNQTMKVYYKEDGSVYDHEMLDDYCVVRDDMEYDSVPDFDANKPFEEETVDASS